MCTFAVHVQAQEGVAINNDGASPDASSILDLKSTTKGILIPRMTESQRTLISNVATGLLVYQTDGTSGFYFYSGSGWESLSTGSSGWNHSGNAGTTNGTDFIGTIDAQDLDIRTNNVARARITQKGQIETLNTGNSVFIGEGAGANDDLSDNKNVFVGKDAGASNTTGTGSTPRMDILPFTPTRRGIITPQMDILPFTPTRRGLSTPRMEQEPFTPTRQGIGTTRLDLLPFTPTRRGLSTPRMDIMPFTPTRQGIITPQMDILPFTPTRRGLSTPRMDIMPFTPTRRGIITPHSDLVLMLLPVILLTLQLLATMQR